MGLPFLENYFTIYDWDNKRVGVAISTGSSAAVRDTFSQGIIALIALSVILFFPLSVFGLYMLYKIRRYRRNKA